LANFFNNVFYDKYVEVLNVNQKRGRFFIEFIDFAFVPLIFYQFIFSKRKIHNIYGYVLLISILFLASISNFRTHLLMVLFSLMLTVIFVLKKKKKVFLIFSIILGFLLINYFGLKSTIFPKITIERVSFSEEEFGSIIGRFNMWNYAHQMFRSSPLMGIGLGNYYDYLPKKEKTVYSIFKEKEILNRVTLINPHNIFFWLVAETGLLGLISFIFLLACFLRQDWNILSSSDILNKSLIISFWTLFLYSFFNPPIGLRFQIIFFTLRFLPRQYKYN
jgi:O-antigen ligase